ncbi:ATP-dependent metallopeptidase FtsH/Yme1/Tma family protein [Candidatus Phytoplasma pini]|uniref:HflB protease n=1 Tax=Candidatus Phytoplasma pini TaxID=267362 RepID=A0A559KIY8_9MOLU|nr:AAA family ATPase [Candidatus Phytoplasma pini]TVY12087.1 HflB protease [Candidatus Phytoplasma pini]
MRKIKFTFRFFIYVLMALNFFCLTCFYLNDLVFQKSLEAGGLNIRFFGFHRFCFFLKKNVFSVIEGFVSPFLTLVLLGGWGEGFFRRSSYQTKKASFLHTQLTFQDVAGNEDEKEELKELVDYLKHPKRYVSRGAFLPHGILLEGPPGTGKTLLAKALAGEAQVPFFYCSGSEFVEMFVGVGASRVRQLFQDARSHAPCIIFIDEIDVLAARRDNSFGHQEKNQTLNQFLVEMDGFTQRDNIVVIGSTNRADMLDSAVLRPGRFDLKFVVSYPDLKAREAIYRVHLRNKNVDSQIDILHLARLSTHFSGAMIATVVNQALVLSVRQQLPQANQLCFEEAIDRVLLGPAKKSLKYNDFEKKMVAYHEAGHAVISLKLEYAKKVQKITIIPRGNAGGYNLLYSPDDFNFSSKKKMQADLVCYLGGRVAEELVFDDISDGAFGDYKEATRLAEQMITKVGFGELKGRTHQFSDRKIINQQINSLLEESYSQCKQIMQANRVLLDKIALLLIEQETITFAEIQRIVFDLKI